VDPNAQKKARETPVWGKCFPVAHSLSLTVLTQIGAADLLYQAPAPGASTGHTYGWGRGCDIGCGDCPGMVPPGIVPPGIVLTGILWEAPHAKSVTVLASNAPKATACQNDALLQRIISDLLWGAGEDLGESNWRVLFLCPAPVRKSSTICNAWYLSPPPKPLLQPTGGLNLCRRPVGVFVPAWG